MNLPNKITLSRICLIPLVVFFYLADFIPYAKLVSALLFVVACSTDFIDGKIARKTGQVTMLGKFFDAIADKVLIMAGLVLICAVPVGQINGSAAPIAYPQWLSITCVILILAREFSVSALRQVAAAKGVVLAAGRGGKVKAFMQDVTVALYMFYAFYVEEIHSLIASSDLLSSIETAVSLVLAVLLVVSTILTISSAIDYMLENLRVFKDSQNPEVVSKAVAEDVQLLSSFDGSQFVSGDVEEELQAETAPEAKPVKFDSRIREAMDLFFDSGWASSTMLQNSLGVSVSRANKILHQMEDLGLISKGERGRPRKILVSQERAKEILDENL